MFQKRNVLPVFKDHTVFQHGQWNPKAAMLLHLPGSKLHWTQRDLFLSIHAWDCAIIKIISLGYNITNPNGIRYIQINLHWTRLQGIFQNMFPKHIVWFYSAKISLHSSAKDQFESHFFWRYLEPAISQASQDQFCTGNSYSSTASGTRLCINLQDKLY